MGLTYGNFTFGSVYKENYVELSNAIHPISDAISMIADQLALAKIYTEDENGEKYDQTEDDLVYLLNHPNQFENKEEFIKRWVKYLLSSGYCYIEPTSESKAAVKRLDRVRESIRPELELINPDHINWNTNNYFRKKEGRFKYRDPDTNSERVMEVENLIPFYDRERDPSNPYKGISRLCSLKNQINNYHKGKIANGVKIDSVGHFVVHPSTKSMLGFDNLDQPVNALENIEYTQKDLIEDNLMGGGLTSGKTVTTLMTEVGVINLAESIQNYKPSEDVKEDKREIYNEFNIPRELQNIGDDAAKYENRQRAELWLNSNVIQPLANNFAESIRNYYNWERKVVFDWSDSPFFGVYKKEKEESNKMKLESLMEMVRLEVYTPEEARNIIEDEQLY